jgi:organic radical activating enzyme
MPALDVAKWLDRGLTLAAKVPAVGALAVYLAMHAKLPARVVTLAKARNFLLAHAESKARAVTVRSLPYVLNLDTLNVCNLACPFCATGTGQLARKPSRFPLDEARALVDKVREHVLVARFHNWGEPFLNRDIFELIAHAHGAGLYTTVSSNLSVEVAGLAEKIVDSGLDKLHVSIDGLEQSTLERYRRNASMELVLKNIAQIVAVKRQRGVRTPRLDLVMLVFSHNEHEVPRLQHMAKELGVDSFTASRAFIYDQSFVPSDPQYRPAQAIWQGTCGYLYSELMVEADGGVSPCCTNTAARFDVGHVTDIGDVGEFWNRPVFQAMRARSGGRAADAAVADAVPSLCDHCHFVGADNAPRDGAPLSPLPPALAAAGETFRDEQRSLGRRV